MTLRDVAQFGQRAWFGARRSSVRIGPSRLVKRDLCPGRQGLTTLLGLRLRFTYATVMFNG